jgi:hypothetical protein
MEKMHLNGYRMMNIKNVANVMESFIGEFYGNWW